MIDTISRHRPLALLASLVLAQVLLLAFQIRRNHDVRLVRYWAEELVTPVEGGATWTFSHIGGVWEGYIGLHHAHVENQNLRSDLDRLQLRNRELEAQAAEAQHLEILLNFHQAHPETPMLAAQVIGASADPISRTIVINRGERDHVRRNLAVITPDGVVGKIVEVLPSTSQVLLINDKDSGVGALFAVSRTQGVVKGSGGPDPRMEYVVNDEKVQPGDLILTSGEDRIFPKGLPIGSVEKATPGNPFQTILVKPAVRLDRLEDVIVLLTLQEIASPKTEEDATGESGEAPANAAKPPAAAHPSRAASHNSPANPAPTQTAPAPVP